MLLRAIIVTLGSLSPWLLMVAWDTSGASLTAYCLLPREDSQATSNSTTSTIPTVNNAATSTLTCGPVDRCLCLFLREQNFWVLGMYAAVCFSQWLSPLHSNQQFTRVLVSFPHHPRLTLLSFLVFDKSNLV